MVFHSAPFLFAPFGLLLMVLVIGTIGYMGIKLARTEQTKTSEIDADQALATLRQRYANGEIDEETYETRARTLRER